MTTTSFSPEYIESLRAENKRLREALEYAADVLYGSQVHLATLSKSISHAVLCAQEAYKKESTE
jgi:hypothetical protein